MDEWYEPTSVDKEEEEEVNTNAHEYLDVEERVVQVYENVRLYTRENEPLLLAYMEPSHIATFLYSSEYLRYVTSIEEGPRLF